MINYLENKDIQQLVELIKTYLKDFNFVKNKNIDYTEYYTQLVTNGQKDNTIIVYKENDVIHGAVIAIRGPQVWDPYDQKLYITSICISHEKRKSSVAYRLIKFVEKEFKDISISYNIPNEVNFDLTKLGYKITEKVFTK